MKTKIRFLLILMAIFCLPALAIAYDSGSTGDDGAFNPQGDMEVVLPDNGVLNYTTVDIPAGVTVTFKKNTMNTPVYMLATGDVNIAGTIQVSATSAAGLTLGQGGPGGYDGGIGGSPSFCGGAGLGPGGGKPGVYRNASFGAGGGGGSFGTSGGQGETFTYNTWQYDIAGAPSGTYGNDEVVPFVGGSGGSGGCSNIHLFAGAGGGGGGAILIASSGTVNVTGAIYANGGDGGTQSARSGGGCADTSGGGGGGSGGAIKILASVITGNGVIEAKPGVRGYAGSCQYFKGGNGGNGRVRFETTTLLRTAGTSPTLIYSALPSPVFPESTPVLKIVSIGGRNVPDMATGSYGSPDIVLPHALSSTAEIVIEASNIPSGTDVVVEARPELGEIVAATATLAGTDEASSATASVTLSKEYASIITVTATFSYQTASNQMPLYVNGEKIEKVRVTASLGGGSIVTYITESGREIPAALKA